jgi:outer membrane protein assembly factor BamB
MTPHMADQLDLLGRTLDRIAIRRWLLTTVAAALTVPDLAPAWSDKGADGAKVAWPSWRGPKNNGVAEAGDIPVEFGPKKNLLWSLDLPGPAGATPVLAGDTLLLTSLAEDEVVLLAVSTEGKEKWRSTLSKGNRNSRGDEGNSASPSPVTDGEHVWTLTGLGDLSCHDLAGKRVWSFNVNERYGKVNIQFGLTSTPVLHEGRLYVQLLYTGGRHLIAVDAASGKDVWKHDRTSDAYAECEHSYASPMLYDDGKVRQILVHGGDYVSGHRLDDGGEIWRCGDLNPKANYNPTLRFVASPACVPGLIVVPTAKGGKVVAIDPTKAEGDITEKGVGQGKGLVWVRPRDTPDVPSPVIADDLVYLCRENGVLIAMDRATGKQRYMQRTFDDRYRASPVLAGDKLLLTSRKGTITVVKTGATFERLAENKVGDEVAASPVVVGGRIYIRGFTKLMAFGKP